MIRTLIALRLIRLAGRILGKQELPRDIEIERLRAALGEITTTVPAEHPACQIALRGLAQ